MAKQSFNSWFFRAKSFASGFFTGAGTGELPPSDGWTGLRRAPLWEGHRPSAVNGGLDSAGAVTPRHGTLWEGHRP